MAQYRKVSKLHNPPAKRRKKLSPKQIKYFGTSRQRAALKAKRSRARNPSTSAKRTRSASTRASPRARTAIGAARTRGRAKAYAKGLGPAPQGNVGEIITISLPNSGTRRKTNSMAKAKRRRKSPVARRRTVVARKRPRRRSNPAKVVYRTRARPRKRARARRNPAGITSGFTQALGVTAGATLNKMIVDGVLPPGLKTGFMGYLSTAVIAMAAGPIVGKMAKNKSLGESITLGGWVALALRLANDFMPQIPLGLSLNGMGRVIPSQFAVPRAPIGNSFSRFVAPGWTPRAALPPAAMNGGNGVGAYGGRRMGRMA